ncbi:MAG: hypothetical protein V1891_02685 [bacterium]
MKVIFIEVELEASALLIPCNENELIGLDDIYLAENTTVFKYFQNKIIGFRAYGDWLADQRFESIDPKPDLLIILADCAEVNDIKNLLKATAEKMNIPIVFFNKIFGEYLIFGKHKQEDGFFYINI